MTSNHHWLVVSPSSVTPKSPSDLTPKHPDFHSSATQFPLICDTILLYLSGIWDTIFPLICNTTAFLGFWVGGVGGGVGWGGAITSCTRAHTITAPSSHKSCTFIMVQLLGWGGVGGGEKARHVHQSLQNRSCFNHRQRRPLMRWWTFRKEPLQPHRQEKRATALALSESDGTGTRKLIVDTNAGWRKHVSRRQNQLFLPGTKI